MACLRLMNKPLAIITSLLLLGIAAGCSDRKPALADGPPVSLTSLLERMTDVNTFARAPLGETFLESSYDRSGGNQDWATYTETEDSGRITLLNVEGPGYVSRVWVASFAAERWQFFFDGEDTPRLDLAHEELFGGKFPFVTPLAGKSGGGRYSLLPIPFSKGLRIEIVPSSLKPSTRNYFQINYTRLNQTPESVTSFPRALSSDEQSALKAAGQTLLDVPAEMRKLAESLIEMAGPVTLSPGQSIPFLQEDGKGTMTSFAIQIDSPAPPDLMQNDLLRALRIQMFWDGADTPSVDVPLGDFFCNPFYTRDYASMALAYVDGIYVCRFPMPYEKGARCYISNASGIPLTIRTGSRGAPTELPGVHRRFHAIWSASASSGVPLTMLRTSGQGHYIGCLLSAVGQDGSWTILEGDEYLRPDPGKRAAQLGTGLEDYFSGAYYYKSLFDLPFHGLIEKGAMRTDQYRFHMLDTVAYDESFESGIEFGDGNRAQGYMSSVAYWYAEEATPAPLPPAVTHLLPRPMDRFELPGMMSQFFLLERAGLFRDAGHRADFFARRYAGQPWSDLLKARTIGYQATIDRQAGGDPDAAVYKALSKSTYPQAAEAARNQAWLEEDDSHALLGVHALCEYTVYLDGEPVVTAHGKADLRVVQVKITPGEHVWTIDAKPTQQGSFISLCLRTGKGDITSAGEWDVVTATPLPGSTAPETFSAHSVFPNMTVWAFPPNAYVNMQSPPMGITLWKFYGGRPLVQQVRMTRKWNTDDAVLNGSFEEKERSSEELRAHAIN